MYTNEKVLILTFVHFYGCRDNQVAIFLRYTVEIDAIFLL